MISKVYGGEVLQNLENLPPVLISSFYISSFEKSRKIKTLFKHFAL